MGQRQDMDRGPYLDPLGARRDLARDIHRRAQHRAARLLMYLGKPEHIETPAIGRLDLLETLVERLGVRLTRYLPVKLVIPAEFHGGSLRRAAFDPSQSLGRAWRFRKCRSLSRVKAPEAIRMLRFSAGAPYFSFLAGGSACAKLKGWAPAF